MIVVQLGVKMTQNEHKPLIVELARLFKPKVYVELGVGSGYVFNAVLPYVGRYAFGVDIDLSKLAGKRNYELHTKSVQIFETSTDDAAKLWPVHLTIDLLFIDADHSAEQVRKDFITWSKFVTPGTGLILLHDTYPCGPKYLKSGYCNDAWKVADVLFRNGNNDKFEIVTIPGPHAGLSIIRKRGEHHLHWMEGK
jgi:predicted O-methyltransferase YrrM